MKERLTGAIILVALIVLLVPELLTGPVNSAPRAAGVASASEEPPLRSYTIKLADEPHARGASLRTGPDQPAPLPPAPEIPAASAMPAPAPAATEEAAARTPATGPAAGSAAAPVASGTPGGSGSTEPAGTYVVQLGSFASRANADRLAKQVRAQGFRVSVSQGSSGHLYRVRVGPAHDRSAAGELAQQLRAHGHAGEIVPK